jgi:hypothetical protein
MDTNIVSKVTPFLAESYDFLYAGYADTLSDEHVAALLRGEVEEVRDDVWELYVDSLWVDARAVAWEAAEAAGLFPDMLSYDDIEELTAAVMLRHVPLLEELARVTRYTAVLVRYDSDGYGGGLAPISLDGAAALEFGERVAAGLPVMLHGNGATILPYMVQNGSVEPLGDWISTPVRTVTVAAEVLAAEVLAAVSETAGENGLDALQDVAVL